MPDGLAAFLTERLDEAEATARAASSDDAPAGDTWHQDDPGRRPGLIIDQHGGVVVYDEGSPIEVQADHIAANDPARTLRGIAAKRRILELSDDADWLDKTLDEETARTPKPGETTLGEEIRRNLAAEWNDHPAYQPGWSPEPAQAP